MLGYVLLALPGAIIGAAGALTPGLSRARRAWAFALALPLGALAVLALRPLRVGDVTALQASMTGWVTVVLLAVAYTAMLRFAPWWVGFAPILPALAYWSHPFRHEGAWLALTMLGVLLATVPALLRATGPKAATALAVTTFFVAVPAAPWAFLGGLTSPESCRVDLDLRATAERPGRFDVSFVFPSLDPLLLDEVANDLEAAGATVMRQGTEGAGDEGTLKVVASGQDELHLDAHATMVGSCSANGTIAPSGFISEAPIQIRLAYATSSSFACHINDEVTFDVPAGTPTEPPEMRGGCVDGP